MPLLQFLVSLFTSHGYFAVFAVLLICGFGVPIPEDITLVAGGIIAGLGYANVHVMCAIGIVGALIGDSIMFLTGYHFGFRAIKLRWVSWLLTPRRYARAGKIQSLWQSADVHCAIPAWSAFADFSHCRHDSPRFIRAFHLAGWRSCADQRADLGVSRFFRCRKSRVVAAVDQAIQDRVADRSRAPRHRGRCVGVALLAASARCVATLAQATTGDTPMT